MLLLGQRGMNIYMPALSMFYGIIVRMQSERGGKHNKPHIHVIYGEDEIVVSVDGEILEGNFPNRRGEKNRRQNHIRSAGHRFLCARFFHTVFN